MNRPISEVISHIFSSLFSCPFMPECPREKVHVGRRWEWMDGQTQGFQPGGWCENQKSRLTYFKLNECNLFNLRHVLNVT